MHIALDFDETCVTNGRDVPGAVDVLRRITARGHKLCLWTCRYPKNIEEAISWFHSHGIPLHGTNRWEGSGVFPSPKIIADLYIDDKGLGCPVTTFGGTRVVDWVKVAVMLEEWGELPPKLP